MGRRLFQGTSRPVTGVVQARPTTPSNPQRSSPVFKSYALIRVEPAKTTSFAPWFFHTMGVPKLPTVSGRAVSQTVLPVANSTASREEFSSWSRFSRTRSPTMMGEVPEPKPPPLTATGRG